MISFDQLIKESFWTSWYNNMFDKTKYIYFGKYRLITDYCVQIMIELDI